MAPQVSPPRRNAAALAAQYGEGARIYVGGVPDLVSVNMVRSHFSRWGQVRLVSPPCSASNISNVQRSWLSSEFSAIFSLKDILAASAEHVPYACLWLVAAALVYAPPRHLMCPSSTVKLCISVGSSTPTKPCW